MNYTAIQNLVNDHHGCYVPQVFAQNLGQDWCGIKPDDLQILLEGPDNDTYWETWDDVLSTAYYMQGAHKYTLHQDGDLWALCPDRMTNEEYGDFFGGVKPPPDDAYVFEVCGECIQALANDSWDNLTDQETKAIQNGITHLNLTYDQVIVDGAELGFSWQKCECCDSLPGERYRVFCFKETAEV